MVFARETHTSFLAKTDLHDFDPASAATPSIKPNSPIVLQCPAFAQAFRARSACHTIRSFESRFLGNWIYELRDFCGFLREHVALILRQGTSRF